MKELFEQLVQKVKVNFIEIVRNAFNANDVVMINCLLNVYNTFQDEERNGADYIFDFKDNDDLVTCFNGGLTAEELAELVAKYNCKKEEDKTTKFLFGYNHETPLLLTHSALKNTIIGLATEIVECMLQYPFCYEKDIYCKILTDHVVECDYY